MEYKYSRNGAVFVLLRTAIALTLICKVVPVLFLTEHHETVLGEWMYTSTHSLTSALDGGGQLHAPAALPSRKEPLVPIG
jgi:hypothetical protein